MLLRAVQSAGRDLSLSITHLKQHLEAVADADLAGDSLLQSIEQQHAIRYCLELINDLADASTTDSKVSSAGTCGSSMSEHRVGACKSSQLAGVLGADADPWRQLNSAEFGAVFTVAFENG